MLTMQHRLDRLDRAIAEGRIVRGVWTDMATDGRELVCLLAALSPEAGDARYAGRCPASVMPSWLAHLTPWIDDAGSCAAWPEVLRRYASLARRWHVLDDVAWHRLDLAVRRIAVVEARSHVPPDCAQALFAINGVIAWLDAGAPESTRRSVRSAAAEAAVWAAAAAEAAVWAAEAAAAAAAARAAAAAAAAAVAAVAEAEAAVWAAAAADRIIAAVLDAIEVEIVKAEAA